LAEGGRKPLVKKKPPQGLAEVKDRRWWV